jgi:uncharacterized protein with gpF-like domain
MKNKKTMRPVIARRIDEKKYADKIKSQVIKPLLQGTTERLATIPQTQNAWREAVKREFDLFEAQAGNFGEDIATEAMEELRIYHRQKTIKSVMAAISIDISPMSMEFGLRDIMKDYIKTNAELITSIPIEMKDKLLTGFEQIFDEHGFDQEKLLHTINKEFKIGGNRAKLIASDQTGKLISDLSQARQTKLGIPSYIWKTVDDMAVVGTPGGKYPIGTKAHNDHFHRNGKEFFWSQPPPDGHPGKAINCRCVALPVIPGFDWGETPSPDEVETVDNDEA